MKEIMLPYVFICWILVKTGLVKWTLKNAVIIVGIGIGVGVGSVYCPPFLVSSGSHQ